MKRLTVAAVFVLLVSVGPLLALQGVQGLEVGTTVAELAKLNVTLREIADLMARQVEQTGLDLLMKRTQLAQAQLERAEAELKTVEDERASAEEQRTQLETRRELTETQLAEASPSEREAVLKVMEVELATLNLRVRGADAQIASIHNRIAAAQEELRGWKTLLDRRLSTQ